MAFELETPTSAKLVDVIVLSDKDRAPETNPGAGLDFAMTVGNDVLTMFDGFLRGLLYTKNASSSPPAQGTLDGVAPISDMPNLTEIGKKLGRFSWDLELTGYTLTCDRGLGGTKSNIELGDCKLTNWSFKGKVPHAARLRERAGHAVRVRAAAPTGEDAPGAEAGRRAGAVMRAHRLMEANHEVLLLQGHWQGNDVANLHALQGIGRRPNP